MWIRHLRDGVCSDVAKLPDAMLVVEGFPAFARQHPVQGGKFFHFMTYSLTRTRGNDLR